MMEIHDSEVRTTKHNKLKGLDKI